MNYQFLNYDCMYKAVLHECGTDKEKTINKLNGAACFAALFQSIYYNKLYDLELTLYCRTEPKENNDNYLVLNDNEINWWINRLKTFVNFRCKVTSKESITQFDIKAKNINYISIRFLCTALRIFFEYPQNELAKDIYLLKNSVIKTKNFNFRRISALNLLNIGCSALRANSGHTLNRTYSFTFFITNNELKRSLQKNKVTEVNSLFKIDDRKSTINRWEDLNNSESWHNTFNERVNKYSKFCKKHENLLYRRRK